MSLAIPGEEQASAIFGVVDKERARLREWLPWVDATRTPEDTRAFIRGARDRFAAGDAFHGTVLRDGHPIGGIGLDFTRQNRRGVIGYWLSHPFCGRGIVTAGCAALIHFAIAEWHAHSFEIRVPAGNTRSAQVARRLGFRLEGTLVQAWHAGGRFHDLNVFGLTAAEWITQERAPGASTSEGP
jgi:ribosomal-protein-serine acetyltransferase